MKTKAQITLYVIIGLLLVVLVGSAFYYGLIVNRQLFLKESSLIEVSQDSVNKIVQDCMHNIILESIDTYGLCDKEAEFQGELMMGMAKCIDFSRFEKQNYKVTAATRPNSANVEINKDNIVVKIDYPMEFSKENVLIKYEKGEFILSRTKSINIELDSQSKTTKENVLVSSDLDLELKIAKGTKITSNSQPVDKIDVYIEEMCPLDSSVLGKVKYQFTPDKIEFSPNALLTIRYEDSDVSRLSEEESFKIVYLKGNQWEFVESSADVEKNKIRATTSHLSEWATSCDGSNKYGMQVMFDELLATASDFDDVIIERDLRCASNFSGTCGYVKVIIYLKPEISNSLDKYDQLFDKIYDAELIPIITLKEEPKDGFWKHPGDCEADLDCKYGQNEDGSGLPVYDYSGSISLVTGFLNKIHTDKPQWPLYVEIWSEPNLALEWNDISVEDYQIKQYARYFSEMAEAIKALPHAEAIKVMPAGMAPTTGMKKCELSPVYAKQYDQQADSYPILTFGTGKFTKGDCKLLGYMTNYLADGNNYCLGETLPPFSAPSCPNAGDCKEDGCFDEITGDPECCEEYSQDEEATCECNPRNEYLDEMKSWKTFYEGKGLSDVFKDITPEPAACDFHRYDPTVEYANKIRDRIKETIQPYCYEKITEVPTNEYLVKLLSDPDYGAKICQFMDMYADHSYPSVSGIATYPGGDSPFGMEAYKVRFNLVNSYCSKLKNYQCTSPTYTDTDNDGIRDISDNCPYVSNQDQVDWDLDGKGDVCDDSDNDDVFDSPYGLYDRVVNDIGVPKTSFKATDVVIVATPIKSADGLHKYRRVTQITEIQKTWENDPLLEKGFVDLMKYDAKLDELVPTPDLLNGESDVLKTIAGKISDYAGNWDAIWQDILLRTKYRETIVKRATELDDPDMLEAPFVILCNDMFHIINEKIKKKTGKLDHKKIYQEWEFWFEQEVKKRKIRRES